MAYQFQQPYLGLSSGLQTIHGASGGGAVGGWKELGRTTLGGTGTTITVSSLADKRYYMVLMNNINTGSTPQVALRLGNSTADSGSNYSGRYSRNGAADATNLSASSMTAEGYVGSNVQGFGTSYIANLSAKEKLLLTHYVYGVTGAGTAPARQENATKYAFTSNPIDVVQMLNVNTSTFASGSEVVVLGWDPADTHTTNFWEELYSGDLSGGANNEINSGVFTSKKYLWIQVYVDSSSGSANNYDMRVGNTTIDTGSNYAFRYSINGSADGTAVSQDTFKTSFNGASGSEPCLMNCFIVNNSASEKLFYSHTIRYVTAGAGTAPNRYEAVGKWANTSNQIDTVRFYHQTGASTFGTGTLMKIWGSD